MQYLLGVVAFVAVLLRYWLYAPLESWQRARFAYHLNVCPTCKAKALALHELQMKAVEQAKKKGLV